MNEQQLLARAIEIATEAHHAQKDRYGVPYILHPLRVMQRLTTPIQKTVGILHDVVEDTSWTFKQLSREGFPEIIIEALRSVTKREGEEYDEFVKRSAANPLGRAVKIADLEDNMDLTRLPEVSEKDISRLQKYHNAWRALTGSRSDRS
jgi:(p)ppGpp synthase/HD superfamily hydrolase